ncbi:MAG: hypothetical protein AABX12_02705 [Nanoarchaeota archaeon]
MKRVTLADILFWLAMLVLVGYIIGKITNLINTPEWVDLIPIITITFIIGAFYQKVAGFMGIMHARTDYLKSNLDKVKEKILADKNDR